MAREPVPIGASPRQLLATTQELTQRVRQAQRGTWFPLVLLGLVVAGATPFYRLGAPAHVTCGPPTLVPGSGGGYRRTCSVAVGWPAFIYWTVALVLAYVLIARFYVLRARHRGVGARIRPYVVAGIAAVVLDAALLPVQQHLGRAYINSPSQTAELAVHGLNPLLAIGLALFVLAWAERSRALLAFAVAYLAAALLPGLYSITGLLARRGVAVPGQWHLLPGLWLAAAVLLPGLWLAAAVLLAGGAAFAIAGRRRP